MNFMTQFIVNVICPIVFMFVCTVISASTFLCYKCRIQRHTEQVHRGGNVVEMERKLVIYAFYIFLGQMLASILLVWNRLKNYHNKKLSQLLPAKIDFSDSDRKPDLFGTSNGFFRIFT